MEDTTTMEEGEHHQETEVAPALIAVHPTQQSIAVAVGSDLRVYNLIDNCSVSLVDDSSESLHKDSIRAIRFGANGKLFVSAGDDKLVKIWNTNTWHCICTVSSEKRVSAVAISNNGLFVCFADKFGVIWVVDLDGFQENQALIDKKAVPLLAHYCSIITSLEFSPDGEFIISADRDFKIRVTVFSKEPLNGAHEIQSFCLGHTEYISCLGFVCSQDHPQGFLVSGSGDSTVRLWDFTSGSLLDSCEVSKGLIQSNGREVECCPAITDLCAAPNGNRSKEKCCAAVTDICASPNGSLIAVTIQSLPEIVLLSCDLSAKSLSVAKVVPMSRENFISTRLGTGLPAELLWMVMGVSCLPGSNSISLARVRVISGFSKDSTKSFSHEPRVLEDSEVPGGEQLLQKLQGNLSIEKDFYSTATEAVKIAMHNLLIKKQYYVEKREFKKRGRSDKKLKK